MSSTGYSDLSDEPSALRHLSAEQKERLTTILDRYMLALENGNPLAPEPILAEHPDLADTLVAYFRSLEELHGIAAGFVDTKRSDQSSTESVSSDGERVADPFEPHDQRRLGDYRLLREIGRGGMGVVYEATQISLDRKVALKILPFAAVLDSKQIVRFKNEAQAAAQVHHPNIVPVFAIGMERGVHYYAMQYIDGLPLDRIIEQLREAPSSARSPDRRDIIQTCRNPEFAVKLGIQAAEALHAAHEFGVVHRDIKPSNLLLDREGKLWVSDFGLARFRVDASLTKTGDVVGTRRYMSPEQASGQAALVDQRTDIFSLAITLCELITLKPVRSDDSGTRSVTDIVTVPRVALKRYLPTSLTDLEIVLNKALSEEREERYSTAQEFADDLQRVLNGHPTVAKPPTVIEISLKWARRHGRIVAAAAATASVVMVGLAIAAVMIANQKSIADANFRRAERNLKYAQDVVDRFGGGFAERLAEVPGAAQVRHDMLREALEYYRGFAEQAKDDPHLRVDLAITYGKMAALEEEIDSAHDAIADYRRSVDLFKQLAQDQPSLITHQRHLAQSENNLALALSRIGEVDGVRELYEEAIHIQELLVRLHPDGIDYVGDLAMSHSNLGLLLRELDQFEPADAELRKAIELESRVLQTDETNIDAHRKIAASYNNLAALVVERTPQVAVDLYQKAISHQLKCVSATVTDWKSRSELARTYNNVGAAWAKVGEFANANESYENAIKLQSELIREAPKRKSFRHDLAVTHNNLGLALGQQKSERGSEHRAEEAFETSLRMHRELIEEHPDDVDLQSSLGGVWNNLGSLHEDRQRWRAAADAYKNAVSSQKIALEKSPKTARYRAYLSKHYFNYGRVLRTLGATDESVRVAMDRKKLWQGNGERLYSVAEELGSACRSLTKSSGSGFTSEQCEAMALQTLQQAIEAGFVLPTDIEENPSFATLKNDPRFAAITRRKS